MFYHTEDQGVNGKKLIVNLLHVFQN